MSTSNDNLPASTRRTVARAAEASDRLPRQLGEILRVLPEKELAALIRRMRIRIDPAKRIDVPAQVARSLVSAPETREPSRLPPASRELLYRIAEAGGVLLVAQLPAGLEPLIAQGIIYGKKLSGAIELVLPTAFLLQLKSWDSEDPRAIRALVAQSSFETMSSIASHYLGRPATSPMTLSLEAAWEILRDDDRLREEIGQLPPGERRLLDAIEEVGGEVETPELLDLEREPMRLRGVTGVTASRRGAGFALERRAFLIPVHPNRHIIPTEVARIVGEERRRSGDERRAVIRSFILEEDHAPRRARFASDPAALSMALAIAARESGTDVRAGVGTPRSLVTRMAQRFGREPETIGLLTALSRALGLWDASASSAASPPGAWTLQELTRVLFKTWAKGGAWDEARPFAEVLRLATDNRDHSPIGRLREMVLEALQDLGEGRWVPWEALSGYLVEDVRIAGVERLLRRWAERVGVEAPTVAKIIQRMALETLPALGIVDIGSADDTLAAQLEGEGPLVGITLRLTPRGRALLSGAPATIDPSPSKFIDTHVLRIGKSVSIANVLGLAPFVEIGKVGDQLDVLLTPPALARALSAGVESDSLRGRIEALAPLPNTISQMLTQASAIIAQVSFAPCSAFLWVEDVEVRELLRSRKLTAELFVDPSPPGGLLVAPGVDVDRLVRRCRASGVEIECDGEVLRAGSAHTSGESSRSSATRPRVKAATRR